MPGRIPTLAIAAFIFIVFSNAVFSQQSKCIDALQSAPLGANITSKVQEYGLRIANNELSLEMVMCDLGKPNQNVVLDRKITSTLGKNVSKGERYISYGNTRTEDSTANENALIFFFDKNGLARIMERYMPKKKRFMVLERGKEIGKIRVLSGEYTQSSSSTTIRTYEPVSTPSPKAKGD